MFFRVGGFSVFWLLWLLRGFMWLLGWSFRILCIHSSSLEGGCLAFAAFSWVYVAFAVWLFASSALPVPLLQVAFWLCGFCGFAFRILCFPSWFLALSGAPPPRNPCYILDLIVKIRRHPESNRYFFYHHSPDHHGGLPAPNPLSRFFAPNSIISPDHHRGGCRHHPPATF